MTAGYTTVPGTWTTSGNGMIGASDRLAAAVESLCQSLAAAGECWGADEIGRAFCNGDAKTPGFAKSRDALLVDLADMVNVVRATGGLLTVAGHNYTIAEEASTVGSALPAGADQGALAAVNPYHLPSVVLDFAESDPPPSEFMQILILMETLVGGCQWPDGSMSGLTSMRDAFLIAAESVNGVADEVGAHARTVTANNSGEAAQNFATFAAALQGGGDEGGLRWLAAACKWLGDSTDFLMKQKNAARLQFELSVAFLIAVWAIALAVSWITGGGSVAGATAATEAEGFALRAFLQGIAKSVLMGMVYSGGLDAMGQFARMHEGVQKDFDFAELAKAAGEGAVAGAVMGAAGGWVAQSGNRFATALSAYMRAGGFKGAASKFGFVWATGTAGNMGAQAVVEGHVDAAEAAKFGFAMAGIEGFKGVGKYAAAHFGGREGAPVDFSNPARHDGTGQVRTADHSSEPSTTDPTTTGSSTTDSSTTGASTTGTSTTGVSTAGQAHEVRLADTGTATSDTATSAVHLEAGTDNPAPGQGHAPTTEAAPGTGAAPMAEAAPAVLESGAPGRPSISDLLSGRATTTPSTTRDLLGRTGTDGRPVFPAEGRGPAEHAQLLDDMVTVFGDHVPVERLAGEHLRYTEALTGAARELSGTAPDAPQLRGLQRLADLTGAAPDGLLPRADLVHDLARQTLGREPTPRDLKALGELAGRLDGMGGRRAFESPADALHRAAADHLGTLPGPETTRHAVDLLTDPGDLRAALESRLRELGFTDIGPDFRSTAADHQALRDLLGERKYQDRRENADMSAEIDREGGDWADPPYSMNAHDRGLLYDRMPEADRVALYDYTGSGFMKINDALLAGDLAAIERLAPEIRCLMSALNHLPVHEGPVFRKIYVPAEDLPALLTRYENGAVVTEGNFLSASPDPGALQSGNVHFTIESRTGREVLPGLTADPGEREVLFQLRTRFEVTGVELTPDGANIHLRER
jgi:hypothetical protein